MIEWIYNHGLRQDLGSVACLRAAAAAVFSASIPAALRWWCGSAPGRLAGSTAAGKMKNFIEMAGPVDSSGEEKDCRPHCRPVARQKAKL